MLRELHRPAAPSQWWSDAVIYQVYPRSFASSHSAVGDLPGITSHLPYLAELGVDAVWLSPFYRSPQKDAGTTSRTTATSIRGSARWPTPTPSSPARTRWG